jgi:hypothetical protein
MVALRSLPALADGPHARAARQDQRADHDRQDEYIRQEDTTQQAALIPDAERLR